MPGEIIIREASDNAYIYKATLKVMLEQDYLKDSSAYSFKDDRLKALNEYSSQLIRELIIPKLTEEVNTSKRYAPLRQVYYSLILSQWFKQKFSGQANLYSQLIDKKNLDSLTSRAAWDKQTYFKQYQTSFSQGEYNFKDSAYTLQGKVVRNYMSGGINLEGTIKASSAIAGVRPFAGVEYTSSPVNVVGGTAIAPFEASIKIQTASSSLAQLGASSAASNNLIKLRDKIKGLGGKIEIVKLSNFKNYTADYHNIIMELDLNDFFKENQKLQRYQELRAEIIIFANTLLSNVGVADRANMVFAVKESIQNAFVHGNKANPNYPIFIRLNINENNQLLSIEIYNALVDGSDVKAPEEARQAEALVRARQANLFGLDQGEKSIKEVVGFKREEFKDEAGSIIGTKVTLGKQSSSSPITKDDLREMSARVEPKPTEDLTEISAANGEKLFVRQGKEDNIVSVVFYNQGKERIGFIDLLLRESLINYIYVNKSFRDKGYLKVFLDFALEKLKDQSFTGANPVFIAAYVRNPLVVSYLEDKGFKLIAYDGAAKGLMVEVTLPKSGQYKGLIPVYIQDAEKRENYREDLEKEGFEVTDAPIQGQTLPPVTIFARYVFYLSGDNSGAEKNSASSIAQKNEKTGGIDFRALPAVTQPMPLAPAGDTLLRRVSSAIYSQGQLLNPDKEWQEIKNMLAAGITPSSERIKEYVQSCSQQPGLNQEIDKVISCIAGMLRLEEERVENTEPGLKEILSLLESDKPANEMQLALAKITVEAKEPAVIEKGRPTFKSSSALKRFPK